MENNIIVDAEEKLKREQRLKRFGANDPEYLKQIQNDKSMKLSPDDINPINPKESYKLNIKEEEGKEIKFDKKRLMLFGVNLMNTEDIENYFNFKTKKIYWLNDFTCLVEFDNEESSLETFWYFSNSTYDKSKSELENYNWKKSKNYMKMNRELDIEIRVAEEGDVDKKSDRKESVYYKFYNNKKRNYNKYFLTYVFLGTSSIDCISISIGFKLSTSSIKSFLLLEKRFILFKGTNFIIKLNIKVVKENKILIFH